MDIQALKKARNTSFSKITGELEKIANPSSNQSNSFEDDRFWKPERDKSGNATATIRFLPATSGDELPWVKIFSHGFQGPTGKYYIENSLSTLGQEDPVGQLNQRLWNSGSEANKEIARKQKRRLHYYSNILVLSDPKHPENEGKVFMFKYGKKIFDKLMDKARPTFADDEPVNVFDYWEGANFKLRVRQVDGYPNYDQSTFENPSPVGSDDEIVKIAEQQHKLSKLLDPKHFKSYDELSRKLNDVLNTETSSPFNAAELAEADEFVPAQSAPAPQPKSTPAPAPQPTRVASTPVDEDDMMSFFQSIADED